MPFYPFFNPINSTIIKMLVLVKTPKDISKVLGESITQTVVWWTHFYATNFFELTS